MGLIEINELLIEFKNYEVCPNSFVHIVNV